MGIRLKGQTSGYVEIKAPATAADNTLTFPNGNGSSNQVLTTDGSGGLTFAAPQVSTDTTPQLGGNLDVNGNDIVTTSNGDIDLDPNGSGQVVFKGNATRGSGAVKLNCENNSHGILVKGPPHSAGASYTLTLPNDTGTSGQLLSTNGSGVTSWADAGAAVYYSSRPPLHRGPLFSKTAAATLSIAAGSVLNGHYYSAATAVTMATHSNNTDFAIWQNPTTGALVSASSFTSAPSGASGGSIVAGYHYIPSGRPTALDNGSPTSTAEILEYSIWDLTWRPACPDPRGMTCIEGRFWCDIYFCGSTSYAGSDFTAVPSSKIGLTIARDQNLLIPAFYGGNGSNYYGFSSNTQPGCWWDYGEVANSFGKRLISMNEFSAAAFGAPENGSGSSTSTVAWSRASKWGLAQATGIQHCWTSQSYILDLAGGSSFGGIGSGSTRDRGTLLTVNTGEEFRAVVMGGKSGQGGNSGSRASYFNYSCRENSNGDMSARFVAEHLITG